MTNLNSPAGLLPLRHANGGTVRPNRYYIAGGLASNIYRGSAVVATGTSKQINVASAASTTLLIGVFKGCFYVDAGNNTQFRPYWGTGQTIAAGSIVEAEVFDDPNMLYAIQVSGAAGLVAANVGLLANLVIGTGSTLTGNSADQLDQTTIGSGAQLRIEELQQVSSPQQAGSLNQYGQYAKAVVRFAIGQFIPTSLVPA
jgi:hypothetical protein